MSESCFVDLAYPRTRAFWENTIDGVDKKLLHTRRDRSRVRASSAGPRSSEIEIGTGGIPTAAFAPKIARARADVHSVISVGMSMSKSQKKFEDVAPRGAGTAPQIFWC